MNAYFKIFVLFVFFAIFTLLYSAVVYLIFPDSYAALAPQNREVGNIDYNFLMISNVAILLGTFSSVIFVSRVIIKERMPYLKSMMHYKGIFIGILLGFVMILSSIIILVFFDIEIKYQGFDQGIYYYIIIFILVAVNEEVMARGFILHALYLKHGKAIAVIFSSLLFSLMHIFNNSVGLISIINLFLAGVLFALLYFRNMNLSVPIGLHFSWNFVQGPVFGFNVSGLSTPGIFNVQYVSGKPFPFEGFGLEGSVISLVIIVVPISYLWYLEKKKKQDEVQLNIQPEIVKNPDQG